MRKTLIALSILACSLAAPATAQISFSFGAGPGVSIGLDLPVYPTLQRIPNYPVYYSTNVDSNYFFYDGLYWVFDDDEWHASSWYNGPWYRVDRFDVPVYVLRVPVRYYRHAPAYFRSWRADAPPRWGDHWGGAWEQRRSGWDRWNRRSAPAPAPLPTYQRQYSGARYPQASQQASIQTRSYRYQPRDPIARQHFQQRREQLQQAEPRRRGERERREQVQQAEPRRVERQRQAEQPTPREARQPAPAPRAETRQPQAPRAQTAPQPMPRRAEPAPQQAPAVAPAARPAPPPERAGPGKGHAKGQDRERDGEGRGKSQPAESGG